VSPERGRKGTTGKGRVESGRGPAAVRRLGLLVFGAIFVVLFAVVAIAEGLGDPSVPSGAVALVEDVPAETGEVTEAEFAHALELAAKQGGEKVPKPGDPKYDELKETALSSLFEGIWVQGTAEEWGIEVTDAEVAKELKKVKEESFKSEAEFQEFLKESGFTPADIDERVKLQVLTEQLQEELNERAPAPSQSEIEAYYEAAKSTQFSQKPSRDIRLIVNKDREKAEEAEAAVAKDNSATNWQKVAKKYSEDPTTKENGGEQKGVQEGVLEEPLNKTVFGTPEGVIEGPIKTQRGYIVVEVVAATPESVQELKAVESQIKSTLAQQLEQEHFTGFVSSFSNEWTQRTFCASDYLIERCANFEDDGRPATAPEGCFEADPKGGPPKACPAPVSQLVPAMPGTITPLEPKGNPLPQRPLPLDEPGATGEEGATGLPEGAMPPTGAPPAGAPPTE
jgi:parvulin-like peptidyl-prolyl isomerase